MEANKRLIVALDMPDMEAVKKMVTQLGDAVQYYKVGMELFYGCGSEAVHFLRDMGKQVFCDLKLQDIPNTVAHGAKMLTHLGVTMLTVHATGGRAMMRAAADEVAKTAAELGIPRPKMLAITVLTSMNEEEWSGLRYSLSIPEQVLNLAKLAQASGMDGVVASPQEAAMIRAACGEDFLIVTPGIRPKDAALNDQSRTAAPGQALRDGASYLVVGRPITKAADPLLAAQKIIAEMEGQAE
ncbi:MAG: orotidine-5'-phosphate decarboxylase [Negativicutes bacterium]